MRLTERDKEILAKLKRCKWLTTSQMQKMFFSNVSADAVRKRMRKLAAAKYLQSYQPHYMSEMLHGFGKPPKQIEHLVGINDLRIAAERESPQFFYACWELPGFGWQYPAIPDAVCKLRNNIYLFEYDTGKETVTQLQTKFAQYDAFDFPYTLMLCAENEKRLRKLKALVQNGNTITRLMSEVRS
jgi:hypothetical protein